LPCSHSHSISTRSNDGEPARLALSPARTHTRTSGNLAKLI
jgi:hypothetical protein